MKPYIHLFVFVALWLSGCVGTKSTDSTRTVVGEAENVLRPQILKQAQWALQQQPLTVTAVYSQRSKGDRHEYFSEGDYWWPDPRSADSPYIQKDGMTNPDNFVAHRQALVRFSRIVGALASAYKITGDTRYAAHALRHCRAWFTDTTTLMRPHLLYAQAIHGRVSGRGIGIIDTIHLMEVVQGLTLFEKGGAVNVQDLQGIRNWFEQYITWLTTHRYGQDEMKAENNHGTCWVMQVASFARFTGNREVMEFCRARYKNVLLPRQMEKDGSFPRELRRTKPYGYSLFNLDAMATICQVLTTPQDNLWTYQTQDGKSMKKGILYIYPFVKNKRTWPLPPDVMYWEEWPVAHPFLIFGAAAFREKEWLHAWKGLQHDPEVEEVLRNLPVRNPLIWF